MTNTHDMLEPNLIHYLAKAHSIDIQTSFSSNKAMAYNLGEPEQAPHRRVERLQSRLLWYVHHLYTAIYVYAYILEAAWNKLSWSKEGCIREEDSNLNT